MSFTGKDVGALIAGGLLAGGVVLAVQKAWFIAGTFLTCGLLLRKWVLSKGES